MCTKLWKFMYIFSCVYDFYFKIALHIYVGAILLCVACPRPLQSSSRRLLLFHPASHRGLRPHSLEFICSHCSIVNTVFTHCRVMGIWPTSVRSRGTDSLRSSGHAPGCSVSHRQGVAAIPCLSSCGLISTAPAVPRAAMHGPTGLPAWS